MSVETKLMTADELLAMPHGCGQRYELVNGELITMSPAGLDHGVIGDRIGRHLGNYVEAHRLGITPNADTGYLLARNPDTVLQPDASFIAASRVISTAKYFPGPPDLAIEVISPNDTYGDVQDKVDAYIEAGTRMVIVVYPDTRGARVHRPDQPPLELGENDVIDGADVVPGWRLPLAELFA